MSDKGENIHYGDSCPNEDSFLSYDTPDDNLKEKLYRKRCKDNLLKNIDRDKLNIAFKYAYRILPEANDFLRFSSALVDFSGIEILPLCNYIFEKITSSVPYKIARNLVDPNYNSDISYSEADIIRASEKSSDLVSTAKNINEAQHTGLKYETLDDFRKVLSFGSTHNYLDLYNAMLIYMQNPESTFVFNAEEWERDYDRRPKKDAKPILFHTSGGNIQYGYDYADTELIPKGEYTLFDFNYELEGRWENILKAGFRHDVFREMTNLQKNLSVYGIYLDRTIKADDDFIGYTDTCTEKEITLRYEERIFTIHSHFRIMVNYRYPDEDVFYFICYELARKFCIKAFGRKDYQRNYISVKQREFETCTVIWLVFRRLGLYNPLDKYLEYFVKDGNIPNCNFDIIIKAADTLERMLTHTLNPQQSILYYSDPVYKKAVDGN